MQNKKTSIKAENGGKTSNIAIIGMACRFPGAKNYNEYWNNLITEKNCVGEIPRERWNWEEYYGDPISEENKTNIKYGGFIDDVDKFDPLFFNISPREANYMDPQHRIFLEAAWQAIEDAGYNPKQLAGREIGVYAGVSKNDYAELMREHQVPITSFVSTGTVHSILANRVSYLLDFNGKSEVVDTACSSFLVALDKAVTDINGGFCESAVVGGVNAILSPTMYISHSKSGMLSEDGCCKSFDAKANGYVRSEGVGVVFIKSLDKALSDNDNILGVIRGSAVKHGGRSNFLTAPKVSSQASTISAAVITADVNPKTIGYIEAHGTGTPLGDPIEINALKQAYVPYLEGTEQPYCALTSAKTNVGHLESAAGVAGLIKVLLSIKHRTIPPLLHFESLNPYISLDGSPFYIASGKQKWDRITLGETEYPLRAGISSFGMGGVNAHVIVEEPPHVDRAHVSSSSLRTLKNKKSPNKDIANKNYIVPLSARSGEQLLEYALSLYQYLGVDDENCSISDIAFTLQHGREGFENRVAFVATDYQHLVDLIKKFTENKQDDRILVGDTRNDVSGDTVHAGVARSSYDIAKYWVEGGDTDWGDFERDQGGCRIQLPVYPFNRRRCWFPDTKNRKDLRTYNESTPAYMAQTFSTLDYYVRDHVVKGEHLVPGVRCLETFRSIGEKISRLPVRRLQDVYWMRAIKVENNVNLRVTHNATKALNSTINPGKTRKVNVDESNSDVVTSYPLALANDESEYCTGVAILGAQSKPQRRLNLAKIKARCTSTSGDRDLYRQFKNNGLAYGETFQVIKSCHYNQKEVLCELQQTPAINDSDCMLEPSMLDGVFQSVVALTILNSEKQENQQVPFYLREVNIYNEIPDHCYAYATINTKTAEVGRVAFTMYLCNTLGDIIVEFSEFVKREYAVLSHTMTGDEIRDNSGEAGLNSVYNSKNGSDNNVVNNVVNKADNNHILHYTPKWIPRKLGMHNENSSSIIVFDNNSTLLAQLRKKKKLKDIILVKLGDKFKKVGKNTYTIKQGENDSLSLLWNDLKKRGIRVEGIIYKWSEDGKPSVFQALNKNIDLWLTLTKSLIFAKLLNRVRILYLYPIQASVMSCIHASTGGFSRTLAYENPNISITPIGIEEYRPEILADIVIDELSFYRNAPLNEVQYINGQRNVRTIARHDNAVGAAADASLIRQGGTYLIAGGAGGLGFLFAQHLAEEYGARVILTGRSTLNQTIEMQLNQLRQLGGEGCYYSADISDETSLMAMFKEMKAGNIQVNGVLNCAGLIEDSYIINKSKESFAKVVTPKIAGTLNLDEATKEVPLDFFMLFSSIASIMPNQGQCDYAAANSFLDEFAAYRNTLSEQQQRSGMTIAVNWPLWKDGGIGVVKEEEAHLWDVFGMKPLESDRGLAIFDAILSRRQHVIPDQLIAIEGDQYKIEKHLNVMSNKSIDETGLVISEFSLKEKIRKIISGSSSMTREIADTENLTEYGVDSIGIADITAAINSAFSYKVDPTLFFDLNTVEKISEYLWRQNGASPGEGVKARQQEALTFTPGCALIDIEFSNLPEMVFHKSLSDEEFFMKDHVVDGLYNVPGACYIEMALEAGRLLSKEQRVSDDPCVIKLTNNYWAKQLSTAGDAIWADLRFIKKDNHYEYEITHSSGGENAIHALGQLHTMLASDVVSSAFTDEDIEKIRKRCTVSRETEEIYKFIHAEGLHVGPSFQPMTRIVLNETEALSHLKLPDFVSSTVDDYVLHPSLLTGVLQTALLNNKPTGITDSKFIPIAIDEITVHKKIPAECYVYTEVMRPERSNNGISKYNAKVIAMGGEIVVEVKGLSLRNLTHSNELADVKTSASFQAPDVTAEVGQITLEQVSELLKGILADSIGIPPSEIEADMQLESYGINSVMIVELNRCLEKIFGNLSKTLFFEYKSIVELAEYFLNNHQSTLERQIGTVATPVEQDATAGDTPMDSVHDKDADDDGIFLDSVVHNRSISSAPDRSREEPIAIIGVSGRYPDAKNLSEFWENLKAGKDSIRKMPESRFDKNTLQKLFPDERLLPEEWGGFIDDLDKFDPMFFNISPREAQLIDPQERLFLEVAWETIEDAGYNYNDLKGLSIGVFAGALWQPYIALGIEQTFRGNLQRPHGLLYSIANRVSFFFDWCGPSLAVDTACSASLTALHLACESLKRHESHSAIAGGVNISLSSSKYLWLSHNNFLSSDGKCRSFGDNGDGYVPGEGVGTVYLKRLSNALEDDDHIYGVIRGTSINHGGKTNGYTVPNPTKQAELILSTLDKSGISPEDISYIEAHGTGTSLGDPIEVTGLQKAFSSYTDKKEFCAIGSVKSNIGHLEAAAGIAGLTKLLLQMKHKTLVPSIHSDVINPNIDFPSTCFVLQRELKEWVSHGNRDDREHKNEQPLKAMISSFGAGGSNAHAIIEQYQVSSVFNMASTVPRLSTSKDVIVPVSAKSIDRLKVAVTNLLTYIDRNESLVLNAGDDSKDGAIHLEDIAFTLQIGREAMDERVVFLVSDLSDLKVKMEQYISGESTGDSTIIGGNVHSDRKTFNVFSLDANLKKFFSDWTASGDGVKIATLWASGIAIDWRLLYRSETPRKISLPTYPFRKDKYWISLAANDAVSTKPMSVKAQQIHPLLHKNTSNLYTQRYSSSFTGREECFNNALVVGGSTLSSMAYLEMAYQSVVDASGIHDRGVPTNGIQGNGIQNKANKSILLYDVVWLESLVIRDQNRELHIALTLDEDLVDDQENINFEIYTDDTVSGEHSTLHARGTACVNDVGERERQDLSSLLDKSPHKKWISVDGIFQPSNKLSHIDKGKMEAIDVGDNGVLFRFTLMDKEEASVLSVMSSPDVLSTMFTVAPRIARENVKLSADRNTPLLDLSSIKPFQPISLGRMEVYQAFSQSLYAWVKPGDKHNLAGQGATESRGDLDIDFMDGNGYLCGRVTALGFGREANPQYSWPEKPTAFVEDKPVDIADKPSGISLVSVQSLVQQQPSTLVADAENVSNSIPLAVFAEDIDNVKRTEFENTSRLLNKIPTSNYDLVQTLCDSLATALYMQSDDVVVDKQFTEMGLDSIVGVEWINALNKTLSLNINATIVYDYPTIRSLSNYLEDCVINSQVPNKQVSQSDSVPNIRQPGRVHLNEQIETKSDDNGALSGRGSPDTTLLSNRLLSNRLSSERLSSNALSGNTLSGNKSTGRNSNSSATADHYTDAQTAEQLPTIELKNELVMSLAKALYMDECDVSMESTFTDMGLDSIVGVEWVQAINKKFGTAIAATAVYDYTNVSEFSDYLKNVIQNTVVKNEQMITAAD